MNVNVTGTITVSAANVTIDNVCVTTDGDAQLGSAAIILDAGASHTLIKNVTVRGANASTRSVEIAVLNRSGEPASVSRAYFYDCGECVHDGPWTVNDSYIITTGMVGTHDHFEDVYLNNNTVSLNHDTLLNPENQVAEVFGDVNNGSGGTCVNHISVANSLLAGGGFVLYACGNSSSVGSSTMTITNNRIARCRTGPVIQNRRVGGYACAGSFGTAVGSGADLHGYWPRGGYYGIASYSPCPPAPGEIWTGNVWDDNGAGVRC